MFESLNGSKQWFRQAVYLGRAELRILMYTYYDMIYSICNNHNSDYLLRVLI